MGWFWWELVWLCVGSKAGGCPPALSFRLSCENSLSTRTPQLHNCTISTPTTAQLHNCTTAQRTTPSERPSQTNWQTSKLSTMRNHPRDNSRVGLKLTMTNRELSQISNEKCCYFFQINHGIDHMSWIWTQIILYFIDFKPSIDFNVYEPNIFWSQNFHRYCRVSRIHSKSHMQPF